MLCSECQESAEGLTDAGLCPDCYLEANDAMPAAIDLARDRRQPRNMKLKRLLEQITPLPWRIVQPGPPVRLELILHPNLYIQGDAPVAVMERAASLRITMANARYIVHATAVLPELLAAAQNLRDNWEHNLTEPMARLNEAIELAQSVSPDVPTVTSPSSA
jgi:hypothetical protein